MFHPFPINLPLEPLYLDGLSAPFEFAGPIPQLIHEYKYKNVKPIGKLLAQLIFYTATFPVTSTISWIPLHPKRQQDRGFNQAEEIAFHLGHLAKLPTQQFLIRSQATSSQAKLKTREARLKHLATCFKPWSGVLRIPESVLLVDDVTTTGSTLNECAKVLKKLGVKQVFGLVVAHGD